MVYFWWTFFKISLFSVTYKPKNLFLVDFWWTIFYLKICIFVFIFLILLPNFNSIKIIIVFFDIAVVAL